MTTSSPPAFMPLLRPGDLLFTAFALLRRMNGGQCEEATFRSLRSRHSTRGFLFGSDAREVSPTIFGDTVSPRDVMEQHTLFGVYSRAFSQGDAENLAHAMSKNGFAVSDRYGQRKAPDYLRSCARCVQVDLEERGFPAWKVLHQVCSIEHCPLHGVPLRADLHRGGRKRWRLELPLHGPGGVRMEAARGSIPMSDGYAHYLRLWPLVFSGDMPAVRQYEWERISYGLCVDFRSDWEAAAAIKAQLQKQWGMPVREIGAALGFVPTHDFIYEQLYEPHRAPHIAPRLVVLNGIIGLGADPATIVSTPFQTEMALAPHQVTASTTRLISALDAHPLENLETLGEHALVVGNSSIATEARNRRFSLGRITSVESISLRPRRALAPLDKCFQTATPAENNSRHTRRVLYPLDKCFQSSTPPEDKSFSAGASRIGLLRDGSKSNSRTTSSTTIPWSGQ